MLRKGVRFHNGEPVTAEDVKFSWDRYKGASAKLLKDKVKEVEIVNPGTVRFVLREPWPDFITFYGTTASGAGWIVPKKYVEKVGDDGFKAAPVGAGPYKVVSFKPGVELVLEAFDGYWRKAPSVKRLVMRSMPEEATRAAALRAGEVDIAYLLTGPTADSIRKTSGFRLAAPLVSGAFWIELPEQWDPKSPWSDPRVRLAASHAIDRPGINQAEMLGFGRLTGNYVPRIFQFAVPMEPHAYDPAQVQEAPRRGRLPQRLRRGRLLSVPALRLDGRGDHRQPPGRRHPEPDAHDGARGLLHRVAREEAARRDQGHHRRLRQRGHPPRALRHQERRLRLRLAARDRRSLRPAGARARRQEARGDGAPDPADHPGQGDRPSRSSSRRSSGAWGRGWPRRAMAASPASATRRRSRTCASSEEAVMKRQNIQPASLSKRVVGGHVLYSHVMVVEGGRRCSWPASSRADAARQGRRPQGDMRAQVRQVGENIKAALAAAGAKVADVVKTNTYVTDIEEFFKHVDVRMEIFGPSCQPAPQWRYEDSPTPT